MELHEAFRMKRDIAGAILVVAYSVINDPELTESCLPTQIEDMVVTAASLLLINGRIAFKASDQGTFTKEAMTQRLALMLKLARIPIEQKWKLSYLMAETEWTMEQVTDFMKACRLLVALDLNLTPKVEEM